MNKVFKNASWIIGCRIIQAFLALIINMLTARYLGPSNYGVISYAASMVAFVTPLMNLGITDVIVGELVQHPEDEHLILGSSMMLTFVSSIACIIGIISFVYLINPGEMETLVVCFLYSLLLISKSFEMIQYWFQANLLSKYFSLTTLIVYVFISIYKFWLLATSKNIYWFAISNALDYFLISVILLIIYYKKGGQKLKFSKEVALRILKSSYHYILPGMMGVILAQSDRIMIKFMHGNESVGLYSAACSIASLSSFVFAAIIDSMRPSIIECKFSNQSKYENNLIKLFRIINYLSLVQCLVICLLSKFIVFVMYGEEYISAVQTLRIVVWYTAFSYIGAVRTIWILSEKKQKYLWIISLSGAVINIFLNFMWVPVYGINGAAFATLITQIYSNVIVNNLIPTLKRVNKLILKSLFINIF